MQPGCPCAAAHCCYNPLQEHETIPRSYWPAYGCWRLPPCSAATNPAGLWEGTIKNPNGDLGFLFNLHRDGDKWAAEMDVPMQGVSGLPLANVKVDGAAIGFPLPGAGDPHYDGKLSEDGKSISGTSPRGASRFR
jgi:hypothetical protein